MGHDFRRIAIVNRGEPAMRFIHAAREWNDEHGAELRTIALYTDPDRRSMFVREADESVALGPAIGVDPASGTRRNAYLDHERLERALREAGAEAAWAGWGFVAEQAEFVDLLDRMGLTFIGPPAAAMRLLSDKVVAKRLAESAGVPVVPWSGGPVESAEAALVWAARIGYPVMVKASAGGGGRGIRRVAAAPEMKAAFEGARAEAEKAFGDPAVFVEAALDSVRHVEVQVIGDRHGTIWAVGVRDCTVQRRNQKVVEEAPAPTLRPEEDVALREAAVRVARAAGYHSAGTVEFLYQPAERLFHFIEVNARLQVEHTVTEVTTGLDLVKLQIQVARGERLLGSPPPTVGHAIEVRINAEDPERDFAPAAGSFLLFRLPSGPGLRIDCGVGEGDKVAPEFDSMVAKLIAHGRTREEALARLRRGLADAAVVVQGGTTNRAFLLELVRREEFRSSEVDTRWLERVTREAAPAKPHAHVALLQAAVEVDQAEEALEQAAFYASAARLRPEGRREVGRSIELRCQGESYRVKVQRLDRQEYRCELEGTALDARVEPLGPFERWLSVGGRRYRVVAAVQGSQHLVEVEGVPHVFSRDDLGIVRAASPAVVVRVRVRPGDAVGPGDPLIVLEAMKMETTVAAPFGGRVRSVLVEANTQVAPGAALLQIDPEARQERRGAQRIAFPAAGAGRAGDAALATLRDLRRLVLGYDMDAGEARSVAAEYGRLAAQESDADGARSRREDELLAAFADVASLFKRKSAAVDNEPAEGLSAGEYFLTYLRSLDAGDPGLPASFLDKVRRAVAHYGVSDLERGPLLLESLYRIWKSRMQAELQVPAILAILERRLTLARTQGDPADGFATILDRLVAALEGRHPSVADVARDVRYRLFEQPRYEETRRRAYAEAQGHLQILARQPDGPDRELRVAALVACPQPLFSLLAGRFEEESRGMRQLMLEVMTRRYYRIRRLERVRTWAVNGWVGAASEYEHDGRRTELISAYAVDAQFAEMVRELRVLVGETPPEHEVALELYVWRPGPLGEPDANAAWTMAALDAAQFPRSLDRAVVALSGPQAGWALRGVQHFTFRPSPDGYAEDRVYRGLHPLIGERLRLSRLSNFEIERLPSAEDVFLFRGVARQNPKDERLFALAEVRDGTPVRDAGGRVIQIPHLERMFMESAAGIRAIQARRRPEARLHWNRILLEVWPPLDATVEELREMARKYAAVTEGLGLEKVLMRADIRQTDGGGYESVLLSVTNPGAAGTTFSVEPLSSEPIRPLSEYGQKVTRMRQRGLTYPYEIVRMLTPSRAASPSELPPGSFQELDLDQENRLLPVDRPYGRNTANVVVGIVSSRTERYPEGVSRVILLGDPSREMGSIAEPECRRIIAAVDLAAERGIPVEWFTLSAGAKIAMDSGTENMDWISRVLRRIVEFTQRGGELNVIVCGINVGAQPYWNAEATMLMHTKGILVMVPDSAMVLTGKTALDYSGSVSAEDNTGIGGYERIMGPNGEAQYWARDLFEACRILLRHYDHAYVAPGERFPRKARTSDPVSRDVRASPHASGDGLGRVGDVLSEEHNPGRKRPFDIRSVMSAAIDRDHPPLERWADTREAELAVVWDAHLGGQPVCLIGIESKPLPRVGFIPTDGPQEWTAGTLFPKSSKKVARAINAASGSRPLVILANLSGFDGSPESMRRLQLEYGAEIGRAVVNFRGPIVFCVISRYHGGAFVVFSKTLHDNLEAVALEGTYASVIGGAPAAAVVFAREVDARTRDDPRVRELENALAAAEDADKRKLRARLEVLRKAVRSEKLGQVADEFDSVHSVQRALQVGSLDRIIPAAALRSYLVSAVERGMALELARAAGGRPAARAPESEPSERKILAATSPIEQQ